MFTGLKWLRLTPDRQGRGGLKTGIHSFQQQPVNDIRYLLNAHVYNGTWRRDYDSLPYPVPQSWDVSGNHDQIGALHGYVYPSLIDPAAQPGVTILGQMYGSTDSHFWDFSHGTIRSTRPVGGVIKQAAVFRNINQRCFGGDGLAEAVIMDDRTPAIHAQPNQSLGIGTPTQPLTPYGGTGVVPDGTGYVFGGGAGCAFINHPNPDNPLGGCKTGDRVTPSIIDSPYSLIYTGSVMAAYTLVSDAQTSNTMPFVVAGTISITTGTSIVTLTGSTWPSTFNFCGLSINFNGMSYVIAAHGPVTTSDLNGNSLVLNNTKLLILGVYNGPTLNNVSYTITGCQVSMGTVSTLQTLNTNAGIPPPSNALGYSQSTNADLVQVKVRCLQANGLYRNLGNIALGPAGGGVANTLTTANMISGGTTVQFSSGGTPLVTSDLGKTMIVDLAGTGGTMLISPIVSITPFFGALPGCILAAPNDSGVPVVNQRAWWSNDFIGATDIAMASASTTVTSASNPWTANDVGKFIMIAGAGGVGAPGPALFTIILTFVSTHEITVANANASGSNLTGKQAQWGGGTANTHPGPTYAYAWYDPETGHISNISPTVTIPRPTSQGLYSDFANLTPLFQIDPGSISYPDQATDGIRFSHIIFFRTLSTGGSTLYPIGSLQPYLNKVHPGQPSTRGVWNPGPFHGWLGIPNNYVNAPPLPPNTGPDNLWYDFSSDADLILAGGFRAPQFTNNKPMVLLRGGATQPGYPYQIAYWDRRCWIVNTQEPDKIAFSCDDAQCPFGVPEESYPPTNFLRLPSEDGQVIGMRNFGDMLLITTERFAYIVAGNNESNYRLMKISSSMPGVGTYQMDEFPTQTGAEGEPATMFFIGRDRIVYMWTMGSSVVPISQPVQNIFNVLFGGASAYVNYEYSRLHCIAAYGRRLVVVYPYVSVSSQFYVFDIDNQVWNISTPTDGTGQLSFAGTIAFSTVYGVNPAINELYALKTPSINQVIVRSWIRDDSTTSPGNVELLTFPLNFDGKKTRKQIVSVNLHADAGPWSLVTRVNESTTYTMANSPGPYPDPLDSIYGPSPVPVDGATVADTVVIAAQFDATGLPLIGYRFEFTAFRIDTLPGKVYAIDIAYKDAEDPDEGDA